MCSQTTMSNQVKSSVWPLLNHILHIFTCQKDLSSQLLFIWLKGTKCTNQTLYNTCEVNGTSHSMSFPFQWTVLLEVYFISFLLGTKVVFSGATTKGQKHWHQCRHWNPNYSTNSFSCMCVYECVTSASRVEIMWSGAWWIDSSCSGEVSAMSTRARISFSTTSQRLGLFSTLRYL